MYVTVGALLQTMHTQGYPELKDLLPNMKEVLVDPKWCHAKHAERQPGKRVLLVEWLRGTGVDCVAVKVGRQKLFSARLGRSIRAHISAHPLIRIKPRSSRGDSVKGVVVMID
jgi:hypothetical protein